MALGDLRTAVEKAVASIRGLGRASKNEGEAYLSEARAQRYLELSKTLHRRTLGLKLGTGDSEDRRTLNTLIGAFDETVMPGLHAEIAHCNETLRALLSEQLEQWDRLTVDSLLPPDLLAQLEALAPSDPDKYADAITEIFNSIVEDDQNTLPVATRLEMLTDYLLTRIAILVRRGDVSLGNRRVLQTGLARLTEECEDLRKRSPTKGEVTQEKSELADYWTYYTDRKRTERLATTAKAGERLPVDHCGSPAAIKIQWDTLEISEVPEHNFFYEKIWASREILDHVNCLFQPNLISNSTSMEAEIARLGPNGPYSTASIVTLQDVLEALGNVLEEMTRASSAADKALRKIGFSEDIQGGWRLQREQEIDHVIRSGHWVAAFLDYRQQAEDNRSSAD